jgi:hypothetical protein
MWRNKMADERMSLICLTCAEDQPEDCEFLFAKSLGGSWYESNGHFYQSKFKPHGQIPGDIEGPLFSWLERHSHGDSSLHFKVVGELELQTIKEKI